MVNCGKADCPNEAKFYAFRIVRYLWVRIPLCSECRHLDEIISAESMNGDSCIVKPTMAQIQPMNVAEILKEDSCD